MKIPHHIPNFQLNRSKGNVPRDFATMIGDFPKKSLSFNVVLKISNYEEIYVF